MNHHSSTFLMHRLTLVQELDSNKVLKILVSREAHTHIDSGVFRGDLEVPLAKEVVFALLQRQEIG